MQRSKWLAGIAINLLAVGALAPAAHADLKLEQTVFKSGDITSDEGASKNAASTKTSEKRTLYFKQGKSRTDSGTSVEILDFLANKHIVIDTKKKTYYETPLAEWISSSSLPSMKFDGDVTVTDTKEEKKIAGRIAHHYKYAMKFALNLPAHPDVSYFAPTVELSGDQWTIPYTNASPKEQKISREEVSADLHAVMMKFGTVFKPMAKKLSLIKGVSIQELQTIKFRISPSAPEEFQPTSDQLISFAKTDTLSEASLPDFLFKAPVGYTKVAVPKDTDDEN